MPVFELWNLPSKTRKVNPCCLHAGGAKWQKLTGRWHFGGIWIICFNFLIVCLDFTFNMFVLWLSLPMAVGNKSYGKVSLKQISLSNSRLVYYRFNSEIELLRFSELTSFVHGIKKLLQKPKQWVNKAFTNSIFNWNFTVKWWHL